MSANYSLADYLMDTDIELMTSTELISHDAVEYVLRCPSSRKIRVIRVTGMDTFCRGIIAYIVKAAEAKVSFKEDAEMYLVID